MFVCYVNKLKCHFATFSGAGGFPFSCNAAVHAYVGSANGRNEVSFTEDSVPRTLLPLTQAGA